MRGIEQYRRGAVSLVDTVFEAGRLCGIAEERARVKALLDHGLAPSPAARRHPTTANSASYGNVIGIVRPALRDIGEAVDATSMSELVGAGITSKQCRNALRQLVQRGEAVRAARGKFLWRGASESPRAEIPGADTSGYSEAAE